MAIVKSAKVLIRRTIGLWPAMEMWNKFTLFPAALGNIVFENREVARLKSQLQSTPNARVACIIPTYKRPAGVLAAIHSVLSQEFQDFIVMVVNDGGGVPQLLNDPRIFLVSLSCNCGVAGIVRNVGIRLTESEFVAFLDDDNTWTPQHLAVAVNALEEGNDLVFSAVRRRRSDGSLLDVLSKPFDRREFKDGASWVDMNAIVVRRSACSLFSRLPRTRKTLPREDWEFVWRASRLARIKHVPQVTVEYLVNPESYYTPWANAKP